MSTAPLREWILTDSDPIAVKRLATELSISSFLAELLWRRNLQNAASAHQFLYPVLPPPDTCHKLPGVDPTLKRLEKARQRGEQVWVHGDYDVDGLTATALMIHVLRSLDIECAYHIPHRLDEGYGISANCLHRAAAAGVRLIITVDCGSSAHAEAQAGTGTGPGTHHHGSSHTAS